VLSAFTEQIAMEQAKQADRSYQRYLCPLQGIPYGLKDLFASRAPEPPTAHRHFPDR
jgi:Asp-tRNA(Asn)/Glu-tRNA(Gln) amidotransferase A subunit family amidase